jgi:diguanylate cyclase (GGDEF)-like protein
MKPTPSDRPPDDEDLTALIADLHVIGQKLEDLTAGEVDAVADHLGRPFVLRRSQEHGRQREASRLAAILNALPAHIAVLDSQGLIVSVNDAWRRFADDNTLHGPRYGLGTNYLRVCDRAWGAHSDEARQVAAGIRAVLHDRLERFLIEYPCHSPTEQRWFLMTVTPLDETRPSGAVVMHMNISERKQAEQRIAYLNRVYAVLSGINTLIVRVRSRDDLFTEACRIATDAGGFRMALIAGVNPVSGALTPLASAGVDAALLDAIRALLASPEGAAHSMLARALREQRAVISNDSQHDPQVLLSPRYIESGVRSMAVLPLIVRGEAVGLLALYAGESEFFHAEELLLLGELAGDIAFAIDHIGKQERLDYLAYYDELTGLANRNLFLDRVNQHLRAAASGGHRLALFMIDLARFKNINDSLGQPAGDALLRQVGDWLGSKAGDASLFARISADHFAAVLPEVAAQGHVASLLEKLMSAFLDHPFRLNDAVFRVALKVGVALFPQDGSDAETLFKNAEAALKKAKASGDRYLFYQQAMTDTVAGQLTLENQLRLALEREEFVLHYQPKVRLDGDRLGSVEALIRWNDPRTGLVPPGRFIPVLEETGLIYEVGRWALRQAVADYRRWRRGGLPAVRIAVNVSPLQLRHHGFIADIEQAIGGDARTAEGLELEITESLIMEDVKHSITSLQAIREMGLTIAIDDFGTGFSSLSYLSRLPVDALKIDQSFVRDMSCSSQGLALVSTIIGLAQALQLKVVAEGVETEAQARQLRQLRCDEMQGYLFSPPLACDVFEARYLQHA